MKPEFKASYIHSEDMGDYFLVGLADQRCGTSEYLMFQRAHRFDEQDVHLGMDAVHVERNDQGFSGYGGMRSVVLFPDRLHIDFDDRGAAFMGGISATDVVFDFRQDQFAALRSGLQRCFCGFSFFHDNTSEAQP